MFAKSKRVEISLLLSLSLSVSVSLLARAQKILNYSHKTALTINLFIRLCISVCDDLVNGWCELNLVEWIILSIQSRLIQINFSLETEALARVQCTGWSCSLLLSSTLLLLFLFTSIAQTQLTFTLATTFPFSQALLLLLLLIRFDFDLKDTQNKPSM